MSFIKRPTTLDLINGGKYSNAAANTIVDTLGFANKGDGGAAKWVKTGVTGLTASQTPAQTGNGTLTDALGHEWQLSYSKPVSVKALGAVGDGVTDDTTAIASALAFPRIYGLEDESYSISSLTVPANKTIKNIHFLGNAASNLLVLGVAATNVELNGCIFDGNNISAGLISVEDISAIRIINNQFLRSTGSDLILRDSLGVSDVLVHRNTFANSTGKNIRIGLSTGVTITNNTFNGWGATTSDSIEFLDNVSDKCVISHNTFENANAGLFAIECAGDTQRLTNATITHNIMKSAFCGISGRIVESTISDNYFLAGNGNWRSGVEVSGYKNTISRNRIYNGTIVITAAGDTGVPNTSVDAESTLIIGNVVENSTADSTLLYIGAGGGAGSSPTASKIRVQGNIFDASQGSGTSTKVVRAGSYGADIIVSDLDFISNHVIGPNGVASTDGFRLDGLAGSGRVKVKSNTFIDVINAVRLADDNFDTLVLRNNDAADGVNNFFVGNPVTTTLVNIDNDT